MLLSHCGEYMANGLTNAVRHEFVMIATHSYLFVSIRGRFVSFVRNSQGFVRNSQAFVTICKASLFSNSPGQSYKILLTNLP